MIGERVDKITTGVQRGISKVRNKDTRLQFTHKATLAATGVAALVSAGYVWGYEKGVNASADSLNAFQNDPDPIATIHPQGIEVPQSFEFMEELDKVEKYFDPAVTYWLDDISKWSLAYGVNPLDIATLMQIESCGRPDAVSKSGAVGLFQVMPNFHLDEGESINDLKNPDFNAGKALPFFKGLIESTGDLGDAYVQYNAGPNSGFNADNVIEGTEPWKMLKYSGMRVQANLQDGRNVIEDYYKEERSAGCIKARRALGLSYENLLQYIK